MLLNLRRSALFMSFYARLIYMRVPSHMIVLTRPIPLLHLLLGLLQQLIYRPYPVGFWTWRRLIRQGIESDQWDEL